jgi:hypothetical protein
MNLLQQKIKESMKTSIRKVDAWADPDGVIHEEYTLTLKPWCSTIEELANELGLSVSQTYRLLRDPRRKFTEDEVYVIHKQLNWKQRNPMNDEPMAPIAHTYALIELVRERLSGRKQGEELEGTKEGKATKGIEWTLDGRPLSDWDFMKPKTTDDEYELLFKKQSEQFQRLLEIAERQQDLIEKLSAEKEKTYKLDDGFYELIEKFIEMRDEDRKSA